MNLTEIKNSSFEELVEFLDETEDQVEYRKENYFVECARGPHPVRSRAYEMYWKENKNPGYTIESGIDMGY